MDSAVDTYNRLRRSLSERVNRYETAAPWERENLIPFDGKQYNTWLAMAQTMKKRYEADEITAEEFLSAIDIFSETQHEARKLTLPDPRKTLWYESIARDMDFDPAREFPDMGFLDMGRENPEWKIITSAQRSAGRAAATKVSTPCITERPPSTCPRMQVKQIQAVSVKKIRKRFIFFAARCRNT